MLDTFLTNIKNVQDEILELEIALLKIPAPSHKELERAKFVKEWLEPFGSVYIDDAYNCVFTEFDKGDGKAVLITAHTDTVFPDLEPFEPVIDGDILRCPGAGDDTANLAGMMMLIKYLKLSGAQPKQPVIFAANSCEEGLGNLKGIKALMDNYADHISEHISFDGYYRSIVDGAVGSHRYSVSVKTPGGHSYESFGNTNAIAVISDLINTLYSVETPKKAKTTYNVGGISGGTSVNTIAQDAAMLYEYRSEDRECLEYMQKAFESAVGDIRNKYSDAVIDINVLGIRPCAGDVPKDEHKKLTDKVECAIRAIVPDADLPYGASSTDCNIPLSIGVPAVCFGVCLGNGAHTREEYIEIPSMQEGLLIGAELMKEYFC